MRGVIPDYSNIGGTLSKLQEPIKELSAKFDQLGDYTQISKPLPPPSRG